jgi:peptidyl-prolyl cis-trans isomerase D
MSFIQNIRDKYARVAVVAIALSLLGFILMDALSGRASMFGGGGSDVVGSVNGKDIKIDQFNQQVAMMETNARNNGQNIDEEGRNQLMQQVWNDQVNTLILEKEYEALGITVTDAEVDDILFGDNPPEEFKTAFADSLTGLYNPNKAREYFAGVRMSKNPQQIQQMNQFLDGIVKSRKEQKYNSLLNNSIYVAKWVVEKKNADNALLGSITYASVPYTTVADSTIKVTDDEIKDFMNDHKQDFIQQEETRNISYVMFSASPSSADSAAVRTSLEAIKPQFDTTTNFASFLTRQGSRMPFYDSYITNKEIQHPNKDVILAQPVGSTYGPYADQGSFVMSKIIDTRQIPDTVKVRHILISFQVQDPQTQQVIETRDDSTAKRLVDSVRLLHASGGNFDTLVRKFSNDFGSIQNNGVYENVTTGKMVAEFNTFIFTNPVGTKGVVRTEYGYHYIEVLSQKGSSPGYRIAYMAKPILPSTVTENNVYNSAKIFASDVDNQKEFNDKADKELKNRGINRMSATDIKPIDNMISGIGNSRTLVKAIYDADKGDVVGPEKVGDNYIVAVVTDVDKPGMQSVSKVRSYVEPVIRNRKKAAVIKRNIGKFNTVEEVSAKMKVETQTADSVRFNGGNQLAYEPKVIGATFNPANKGKVVTEAIEGISGVFALRVNNVTTTSVMAGSIEEQRQAMVNQQKQQTMYQTPVNVLRQSAKIKDNRVDFF